MAGKKRYNDFIIDTDFAIMKIKRKDIVIDVLIDIEEVDRVKKVGKWHAIYDQTLQEPSYYIAHRYNNKIQGKGVIKLHRYITNCPKNKIVDHINHNTLDNRKQNLKICTHFENQQNLRSKKTEQTGVFFRKRIQRGKLKEFWVANITKNKKRYSKDFKTKEEAIKWRLNMQNKLYKGVM